MAAQKSRFKSYIDSRRWDDIRDAWLEYVPVFSTPGARPDPGLDGLIPVSNITLPDTRGRVSDFSGVRTNTLWEAVFLFHKCAHSHLAAQRLGTMGMNSWSMFNAYHAAYLGARGILALLGIAMPYLPQAGQLMLDLYPQPESKRGQKELAAGKWKFEECLIVRLGGHIDQHDLWDAFQRALRVSEVDFWSKGLKEEILGVDPREFTKTRNSFLYKPGYWLGDDLVQDGDADQFPAFLGEELNAETEGFLLRLSCHVYRLFEELVSDLAEKSGPIRNELNDSRILANPAVTDLLCYNTFVGQLKTIATRS